MTACIIFQNPPSTGLTALSDSYNQVPVCLTASTSTSEMLSECSGSKTEVQSPLGYHSKRLLQEYRTILGLNKQ